MNYQADFDDRSFISQHKVGIIVMAILAAGGITFAVQQKSGGKSKHKELDSSLVMINLPPPPPPPPPPTPPQKIEEPEEEEMISQETVDENVEKPEDPAPAEAPSTGIVGDGPPDGFGLKTGGDGRRFGGGGGRSGGKWGWYASQVQSSIADALRQHPKVRNASMSVEAMIWADRGGRVTRAKLAQSTGNPGLDEAIRSDVLVGLQLREPPPPGMPMPIHLRLSARHTN